MLRQMGEFVAPTPRTSPNRDRYVPRPRRGTSIGRRHEWAAARFRLPGVSDAPCIGEMHCGAQW